MSSEKDYTRRSFMQVLLGGIGAVAMGRGRERNLRDGNPSPNNSQIPTRPLGGTGHAVSIFSIGGQATLEDPTKRAQSVQIINKALDLGVNFIDTAALYGHGASEEAIGEVMKSRRREVFLASKTDDRSYDGSMRQLESSLKRLQTDHLDLWQIHNIQTDIDVSFVLSREGAVKALEKAKEEGIVRFTGITGHRDPHVLRRAIQQHSFDTILMALNAADRHERSFIEHLLPVAVEQQMGIMAMKVPSRGKIFNKRGIQTMEVAMRYVLSLPICTAVIGISNIQELEENARIAREFRPYSAPELAELEMSTQPYFAEALWYRDHM